MAAGGTSNFMLAAAAAPIKKVGVVASHKQKVSKDAGFESFFA